jgi:hypothetical protein
VEEILLSCGVVAYATILYANNGGGERFGGGEIARRQRIERQLPAVEVYERNINRLKIGYSYTGGRARGSDQRGRVVLAN